MLLRLIRTWRTLCMIVQIWATLTCTLCRIRYLFRSLIRVNFPTLCLNLTPTTLPTSTSKNSFIWNNKQQNWKSLCYMMVWMTSREGPTFWCKLSEMYQMCQYSSRIRRRQPTKMTLHSDLWTNQKWKRILEIKRQTKRIIATFWVQIPRFKLQKSTISNMTQTILLSQRKLNP